MFVPLTRLALPLVAALALVACGSNGDNDTPDAGSTPDAGDLPDAGTPDAGGPIEGLAPDGWTWVPFPEAHCRDGSSTGIGVNAHPGATKLMIFLQGGGACFNLASCTANPRNFSQSDFDSLLPLDGGVFNRADPANPVRDYNFVFVPYCTGDVHAGNNPNGSVNAILDNQEFVGFANVGHYLARLVPTFPGMTDVLLTGQSAGGFGTNANFVQVSDAFPGVAVDLVDDAGPPMRAPFLATCLQEKWIDLWNLDQTFLPACQGQCTDPNKVFLDNFQHLVTTHPDSRFGLVSSTGDETIRGFFGFGDNNCDGFSPLSAETYRTGLLDIRDTLATSGNYGDYYFPGIDHTTLLTDFDTRTVAGVPFTTWFGNLLSGTATHVGPQ